MRDIDIAESRRNRSIFFAIGLIVGVAASMLLLVWSVPGFRYPPYQQDRYQNATNHQTGENNPVIRPSFWETYTTPTDTYAQWIMAALSILATGASIWAVWLVRSTLEAATHANQIMRAEQRPWLTLRREITCDFNVKEIDSSSAKGKIYRFHTYLRWRFKIKNMGKSPAFGVKLKPKIIAAESVWQAQGMFRQFVSTLDHSSETQSEYTIFPEEDDGFGFGEMVTAVEYDSEVEATFYLLVAIVYRSQENDIVGIEARLLQITFDHRVFGPWRPKLLEHTTDRVTQ
ncbi:MAG: hypothetical protein WA975_05810 [Mesorhizobium sp.]